MPLNRALIGKVYPPTEPYEVSREKIREFARALHDDNPAYWDSTAARALGYPDVIAPPSFPMIISLEAEREIVHDPDLGLDDPRRFVHRDQRFVYQRPVHAGDVLTVQVEITRMDLLGDNDVIAFEDVVRGADGEHICTAYATFVAFPADDAKQESK